jgi:hypothetical protein
MLTDTYVASGGSPPPKLCRRGHDLSLPDALFPSGTCKACKAVRNEKKKSLDGECANGHSRAVVGVNSNGDCKACAKGYRDKRREFQPEKQMWYQAQRRAKNEGLPFNIDVEDIVIPAHCPVFPHIALVANAGGKRESSPSLDKIVPSLGYVKGNVQVISMKANRMKSDGTLEELVQLGKWAANRLGYEEITLLDQSTPKRDCKQSGHLQTTGKWVYVRFRANTTNGRKLLAVKVCPAEGLEGHLPYFRQRQEAERIIREHGGNQKESDDGTENVRSEG